MVDYPYESIAAGLRAMAGVMREQKYTLVTSHDPAERERIAKTVIKVDPMSVEASIEAIHTYQQGAKLPLPKRIKGWSLTGAGRPYSDWERAAIKPTVKPVFVPAPWVVGVHTDSRPMFEELPERDW